MRGGEFKVKEERPRMLNELKGPHQYEAKFLSNIIGWGNGSKVTSPGKKERRQELKSNEKVNDDREGPQ